MTTLAAEEVTQDPEEATPAQLAMIAALAYAATAETDVTRGLDAWLAGKISRQDLNYAAATWILRRISGAHLAGQHYAEQEWNHHAAPLLTSALDHTRLGKAMDTITLDHRAARAADLLSAFKSPTTEQTSETSDDAETSETSASVEESAEQMIMRATRLAHAEVVKAGRRGYVESVAQAVGDDDDYVWKFTTDPGACDRCIALAARSFDRFEDAPESGHIGCACTLTAEYREE